MKKILTVLTIAFLLVGVLGLVYAKNDKTGSSPGNSGSSGSSSSGTSTDTSDDGGEDSTEAGEDKESGKGKKIISEETITVIDENQNQHQVTVRVETKERNGETYQKIKVRGVEAISDVEIEQEEGETTINAKLSNGNKQEIKIMPDTASQTAIEKLQSKNITIQLKEVGEGNNLSVVYEAEGNKTVKFLGLFKVRTQVTAIISAENGEVLRLEKPWWYFLAFGTGTIDCDENNLDLCEVDECPGVGFWYNETCNLGCPEDPFVCEDNSTIYRSVDLNCEFDACPVIEPPTNETNSTLPGNETNSTLPESNETNSSA